MSSYVVTYDFKLMRQVNKKYVKLFLSNSQSYIWT